jgi:hypothetical protein
VCLTRNLKIEKGSVEQLCGLREQYEMMKAHNTSVHSIPEYRKVWKNLTENSRKNL